jgi:hypothetical protein
MSMQINGRVDGVSTASGSGFVQRWDYLWRTVAGSADRAYVEGFAFEVIMKNKGSAAAPSTHAFGEKALESLRHIEEEAQRQKDEQLDGLWEALGNITSRIEDLKLQRQQVEDAIARITGKASGGRKPRANHDELRARVLRWMSGHAGKWYHASDLQREFPELEEVASVAVFLKTAVSEGRVKIDKSGGNRNTRYSAAS